MWSGNHFMWNTVVKQLTDLCIFHSIVCVCVCVCVCFRKERASANFSNRWRTSIQAKQSQTWSPSSRAPGTWVSIHSNHINYCSPSVGCIFLWRYILYTIFFPILTGGLAYTLSLSYVDINVLEWATQKTSLYHLQCWVTWCLMYFKCIM